MRPISAKDFDSAMRKVRPSVSPESLIEYEQWNRTFGSITDF